MPPNIVKNGRALSNMVAPMHQLWTPEDGYSPENSIQSRASAYGDMGVQLFGPTGEPIFSDDGLINVIIRRYESEAIEWTIPINDSITSEIGVDGISMAVIFMPVAWTAADITFQIGNWSNGTFQDLYDENGSEVVVTAAVGRAIPLPPEVVAASFIKIRSGTTGTPVNQVAARTGWLVAKG